MTTDGWQPIETAPRDGTRVRLLCSGREDFGFYQDYTERMLPGDTLSGEWSTEYGHGEPTHWRPLPPPA